MLEDTPSQQQTLAWKLNIILLLAMKRGSLDLYSRRICTIQVLVIMHGTIEECIPQELRFDPETWTINNQRTTKKQLSDITIILTIWDRHTSND